MAQTQTYQVTYVGKPGKGPDECLPVPEALPAFKPGETRVFDDGYLLSLGVDPADGPEFIKDTFARQNANRPEGQELFTRSRK
jgi:hypothetical protein